MSSAYLESYIKNAQFSLQRLLSRLLSGGIDWHGIQEICTYFRQRGVCSLLLYGVAQPFYINMMQSAGAYLYYLQRVGDEHKVTSQVKPFFDAIGGGFWNCAEAIANYSRLSWNGDYEYEDDFLYVLFLLKYFFLDSIDGECEGIIARFEEVSGGADGARLDICKAFLTADNALFEEMIHVLLDQRVEEVEKMIARNELPEEVWSWIRYFSSEGLALLRLAERRGFATGETYLHVPDSVRAEASFPFDSDAWRNLDYHR